MCDDAQSAMWSGKIFALAMNAKNAQAIQNLSLNVKGQCCQCGVIIFSLNRRLAIHAIFREMPLPLECGQCGSVRIATSAERSALGYFLSEQSLPIDLRDVGLMTVDNESHANRALANCLADRIRPSIRD
jgi:hypothetical protein